MPDPIFARSGLLWETTEGVTVGSDLQSAVTALLSAEAAAEAAFAAATNSANDANAAALAALAATASGIASVNAAASSASASLAASVTSATTTISTSVATAVSSSSASASAAATSATSASGSATAASTSASGAATSAGTATSAASTVAASVTAAATSATNAAASASAAATSAAQASALVSTSGFRNRLINGGMDIWQRGTSLNTASTFYTADQWGAYCDGTGATVVSRIAVTDATVMAAGLNYAMNYAVGASPSGGTVRQLTNRCENPKTFAGKTVRVSFWAKADASRTVTANLTTNPGTGGSPAGGANTNLFSSNLTTSWQFFTGTATLPAASTITPGTNGDGFMSLVFNLPLNTAMTINLTGVQLELDTGAATAFEARPAGVELALAQRFYRTGAGISSCYTPTTGATSYITISYPDMRTAPTVVTTPSAGGNYTSVTGASNSGAITMFVVGTAVGATAFNYAYTASAEL